MAVKFRFHGKSSHAAAAPEEGRSAVGAVELTDHGANILRQFTPDLTRIHSVITSGGGAPNVVPDFAETFYYIRNPSSEVVQQLYPRLLKCAEGAAIATETTLETLYLGGTLEIMPNDTLALLARANLQQLNHLQYNEDERRFADQILPTLAAPLPIESLNQIEDRTGGVTKDSTDVGDVSWVVPTTGFCVATWVPGTPMHSWQAVAAGATSIGRLGMQLAAKTLATTAWDLYQDPKLIVAAKAEHERRLASRKYRSLLKPGQSPPLDYRNPPRRK
jgi:aminobenzoyl-glutamate utilization protein B